MSGRLVDLSPPGAPLPDPAVVDANIVVARLLVSSPRQHPLALARANAFFQRLIAEGRQAILTPTGYAEVLHSSIRARYEQELRLNRQALTGRYGVRISSWVELAKRDPSILRGHAPDLDRLRRLLVAVNVAVARPEDLGPIPSGLSYDEELVRLIGRYSLDTSDASILMEASRLGVLDIVTLDSDLQRALVDFDVYTWL